MRICGSCATKYREPCQAGNRAALSGYLCVPQCFLYVRMSEGITLWSVFILMFFKEDVEFMYLALYRKWRPRTFDDVISQPHITQTLKNQIQNRQNSHAYLFTGPRGTGKTSCSKILAMAVNCLNPVDGNPCLECENCIGIEQGTILDVVEMDAASNNGVDNMRQLRDEASYTPTQCKYRVYILDEAHMLTKEAFNAFLKILEEPPSHVLFILATTESNKIPTTILSRCQRFDFRRIKPEDISQRLCLIAETEDYFTLEKSASDLIARLADGGMRDALSILDQCIAFSPDVVTQTVIDAAGITGKDYLFKLTDFIIAQDAASAIGLVDELYSMSKDLQGLLDELIFHFRNIMLLKTLSKPEQLVVLLPDEYEKLEEFTKKMPLATVLYILSQLQDCLDKMGKSIDKRLNLELCLITICTPSLSLSNEALIARLNKLESMLKSGAFTALQPNQPTQDTNIEQPTIQNPVLRKMSKAKVNTNTDAAPNIPQSQEKPHAEIMLEPFMDWAEVLHVFSKKDQHLWGILQNSQAFISGGFLYINSPSAFAVTMMKQEGNAKAVIGAVEEKTGVAYKIRVRSSASADTKHGDNLLDTLIDNAKKLGIEVNENN